MPRNFEIGTTVSCIFSQFSAAQAQKRPRYYFRSNFQPKTWNRHGTWILGILGVGVKIFLSNPLKGASMPYFTRFEPSIVQIRSRVFAPGECTKKWHYKKRLYFTYSRGIPHPTKFNQNWRANRGRRSNQSHQVW